MPDLTLIVLAAGIGRRFGGSKQIETVGPNGEFILHYSIFDALRAGFTRIILVIRPELRKVLEEEFQRLSFPVNSISYIEQDADDLPEGLPANINRKKPWGTAHATWICHSITQTPFAVINADDFYGFESYRLLVSFLSPMQSDERYYGLVGYPLNKTLSKHGSVSRAICNLDNNHFLISIKEKTRIILRDSECLNQLENGKLELLDPEAIVSMNFWAFTPSFFHDLEEAICHFFSRHDFDVINSEFYLPDMVGYLLANQKARVKVLPTPESWFGLTYPQDLPMVRSAINEFIQSGIYPADLSLKLQEFKIK